MLTRGERNDIIGQMAELKVPWKTRQRPQNYQELTLAAKAELRDKFDELMERAEAVLELFRDFDGVDWANPPEAYKAMGDFGDGENLRCFNELVDFWPDVKSAPGEGYW